MGLKSISLATVGTELLKQVTAADLAVTLLPKSLRPGGGGAKPIFGLAAGDACAAKALCICTGAVTSQAPRNRCPQASLNYLLQCFLGFHPLAGTGRL